MTSVGYEFEEQFDSNVLSKKTPLNYILNFIDSIIVHQKVDLQKSEV